MSVDSGNVSLLVLLDLSAAFDTIDHGMLIKRLATDYGISNTSLDWFTSYLSGRQQSVIVRSSPSENVSLKCGVPQGSVLGPILFTLYTKPLGELIHSHSIGHHFYADDSQLNKAFKPAASEELDALEQMTSCTADIKTWMCSNRLKLNDDKTEAMIIGPKSRLAKVESTHITIGESSIPFSKSVKNLGILLDSNMSMEPQVDDLCRKCLFHLKNIGSIRHLITEDAAATLARSLILSRLDYGNSLLGGAPKHLLDKLQRIQNKAARVVTRTPLSSHITPVLKALHWLPAEARVDFKILSLAYQCVNGSAPQYLCDLVQAYTPGRSLRSSTQNNVCVPSWKLKSFGARSFSVTATTKWNSLPVSLHHVPTLQSFKKQLNTYIFCKYFS